MKQSVKALIKSPAAFVIIILLFLLILLFSVRAATMGGDTENKIEEKENISSVDYSLRY